jgi:lipoprotein NlpD
MLNRDQAKAPLPRTPIAGPPLGVIMLLCAACGGGAAARPIASPQAALPTDEVAPPAAGVRHPLHAGQTLYSLARAYGVPLDVLMRVNGITDPTTVRDGTSLFIPGARRILEIPPTFPPSRGPADSRAEAGAARPAVPESTDASAIPLPGSLLTPGPPSSPGPRPTLPSRPRMPGLSSPPAVALAWPLRGTITSRFGLRGRHHHHEGVDIDGMLGEQILAAAEGTVVRAGREGGFGRLVVIDHGGGLTTLYAHASRVLVREGDEVERGQPIAEVGHSGNAHGSHLHFEVHRDGRPIDPLPMLRSVAEAASPR